jgi:hypothetical protein
METEVKAVRENTNPWPRIKIEIYNDEEENLFSFFFNNFFICCMSLPCTSDKGEDAF